MRYAKVAGLLVGLALITGLSTPADAFDGSRKGFLLGFGVGGSYTADSGSHTGDSSDSYLGFATDFRIGWGVTETVALYYGNRVAWFSADTFTFGYSVGLFGASYYFNPEAPSGYILGSIGISSLSTPFESYANGIGGFGVSGGGGYEFSPHWGVEGTINYGTPGDGDSVISVIVAITGIAY